MSVRFLFPAAITLVATGVVALSGVPDSTRGKGIFERRCTGCHSLDIDKEGPRLGAVYGRAAGSVTSFEYSDALKKAKLTWDDATLAKWLEDPDAFIPGNNMPFRVANADERNDIIAYLKSLPAKQ